MSNGSSLVRFQLSRRAGKDGGALFAFKTVELTLRALQDYHKHQVIGLERFPRTGPALVVFNHSLATYDAFLPVVTVFDEVDRVMWGVADRLIFRTLGLAGISRRTGFTEGTRDELVALLRQGEAIGLAPGGMREALRVQRAKYEVDWNKRMGFVRVSMISGAPIVLAACPRADDIFDLYESPLTSWAYRTFKVPVPAFRGLGPTWVPRPIKLTHLFSEPIPPPLVDESPSDDAVAGHHAYLVQRMGELMGQALHASS